MMRRRRFLALLALFFLASGTLFAQTAQAPAISAGNTAWMMVCTALLLLMTIPGLAFFYGGLVRRKNVLNVMMQCFVIAALVSVQWVVIGYSLSFGSSSSPLAPFIGGFRWFFLNGIGINDPSPYFATASAGRVPHYVFILFQGMFAVITPALIVGSVAERIKFGGFLLFVLLWSTLVYDPITHWVWSAQGWLAHFGIADFAGGTVVEVNSGIAGLVTAILIGRRTSYFADAAAPPHNVPFVVMGAALLWVGWFGFNAGSALAADGVAANALLTTHLAASAGVLAWVVMDIIINGKPTIVGAASGAVAGLVAITPASGFVDVAGALIIGFIAAVLSFIAVSSIKQRFRYDDALDVFGLHGVGGFWGLIGTGIFAAPFIRQSFSGLLYGNIHLLLVELLGAVATIVYCGVLTFVLFKAVDRFVGIKVARHEEDIGLDLTQHNEKAYTVIE